MSNLSRNRAPEGSGVGLRRLEGRRRQPTHGRQGKKALPSGAPMWLVYLHNSPPSPTAHAGTFDIFLNEIKALDASAPNSRIHDYDAR
jgi:hypothetical protein